MKDIHSIISENLIILRKSNKLTQSQLAERIGYSDKAVSRWENGDTLPDINVLYELCDFYGITLDTLVMRGSVSDQKPIKVRESMKYYIAVTSLIIAMVWLIATVFFVYIKTKNNMMYWQSFVWAVPASCAVVLYMNRKFRNNTVLFISSSIFIWTLLAAVYVQFIGYNLWLVFIIGIPVQTICFLLLAVKKYK